MDLTDLLRKFHEAGIMAEATLEKKYSFERTLKENKQALQLLQTDVSKCVYCDNKPYKKGAAYCETHMASDDYS